MLQKYGKDTTRNVIRSANETEMILIQIYFLKIIQLKEISIEYLSS